jgi:tetratricopeptide (TPR) repeat protein
MIDPVQDLFDKSFAAHKAGQLDEALRGYDALLNRQPYDGMLLYLVGNVMLQQGHHGQAITMLEAAVRADEGNVGAWNDLGCALKAEHFEEGASLAWEKSIQLGGRTAATLNNLATLYADSGYPEKALPYIEEALAQDPENPHVHWNKALALLSQGRWAEGWAAHEYRYRVNTKSVAPRSYGPIWKGEKDGLLVVHGEQGLGDEIMFATCLPELLAEHPYAVIECERKLVSLFERSFGVPCIASQKDFVAPPDVTVRQIGMGSMPARYRNSDAEFPAPRAILKADPLLVEEARALVADLPRPLIGYSWMGGTKQTRVQHRSLSAAAVKSMHPDHGTAISLQYGQYADVEGDAAGLLRFESWTDGTDLDKLAAFLMVLDEIVTVCTTLVHMSGALGLKAHVLTPLRSSWRYGQKSGPGAMLWYPQHTLHRQPAEGDWKPVIKEVAQHLRAVYP